MSFAYQLVQARLTSSSDEAVVSRDFVDSRGAYRFDGLENGEYTVTLVSPYYGTTREVSIAGASVENVDIHRRRSDTREFPVCRCGLGRRYPLGVTQDRRRRVGGYLATSVRLPTSLVDTDLTCSSGLPAGIRPGGQPPRSRSLVCSVGGRRTIYLIADRFGARLICSKPRGRVGAVSEGVFRHPEVVEDEPRVAVQATGGGGDAGVAVGADAADGEAAQAGGVLGAVAGADAQAILVEGVVEDVVDGLDLPVATVELEQALGVGGVGGVAGNAEGVFDGGLAGLLFGGGALDEEGLADVGEVQLAVEPGGGPDGAAFDAAVLEDGGLAEVGLGAVGEEHPEVVEQGRLVVLGGEHEVGAAGAEEVGELALGEQGVGGEGAAGEVEPEALEHGDNGADLVGALGLVVGADGQAADFFWVWVTPLRWPTAPRMWTWHSPSPILPAAGSAALASVPGSAARAGSGASASGSSR